MKTSQSSNSRWTVIACIVVILGTIVALHAATLGFRVVATEDARRLQVREHPPLIPSPVMLMPQTVDLHKDLRDDGRVAIVTFFYSSCESVCSALGSEYGQLQDAIEARGLSKKIRLISVTFDERDTPLGLEQYARKQHAHSDVWNFGSIPNRRSRTELLKSFGVVVIPAPLGQFQHNAAFHIVDANGRLRRIFDLDEMETVLNFAISLTNKG